MNSEELTLKGKHMKLRTLLLIAMLASSTALVAATPRESMLVPVSWLAAHLGDANLVLLHIGDKPGYEAAHLPGARHVSLSDIALSDHSGKGLMLEMPAAEELRVRLQKLGISDSSRVIVYYGKDWVSPSTRVLLTLDYAGLGDRASLLDGGMGAWTQAGHETTTVVPATTEGKLSPLKLQPLIVDAAYVRANLGKKGVAVIDARTPAFYDGVETGGAHESPHRTGHIAGAGSVPYQQITDDALKLRPAEELRALFSKAGVRPGDTIIGYCHIGQQATLMLFGARSLGHRVLLYDGSFEDWSRQTDAAVEGPSQKATP